MAQKPTINVWDLPPPPGTIDENVLTADAFTRMSFNRPAFPPVTMPPMLNMISPANYPFANAYQPMPMYQYNAGYNNPFPTNFTPLHTSSGAIHPMQPTNASSSSHNYPRGHGYRSPSPKRHTRRNRSRSSSSLSRDSRNSRNLRGRHMRSHSRSHSRSRSHKRAKRRRTRSRSRSQRKNRSNRRRSRSRSHSKRTSNKRHKRRSSSMATSSKSSKSRSPSAEPIRFYRNNSKSSSSGRSRSIEQKKLDLKADLKTEKTELKSESKPKPTLLISEEPQPSNVQLESPLNPMDLYTANYHVPAPASEMFMIKNDGSFLEMFKKMQEAQASSTSVSDKKLDIVSAASSLLNEASTPKPMPFLAGKRRGGRILKTGVVEKKKLTKEEEKPKDAWALYMQEVRRYKEAHCDDDSKISRPLVK